VSRLPRELHVMATTVVLALALVLPAAVPAATTLYVAKGNPACSNTGPGSSAQPYCSISAAAAKTTAGTTVLVSSGTYTEQVSVRSGATGSPVVFKAAPGATVTVRGGRYGWYVSNKSWVTIDGFQVTDTTEDGFHVSSGSHHVTVVGNHVYETGEPISGMTGKGIAVTDSSDVRVEGNTVERISTYGIYLAKSTRVDIVRNTVSRNAKVFERAASGIRLYDSDANTVASNITHHSEDSGIELVTNSDGNVIANNVAYENEDHGIDLVTALNNRVVANSVYGNLTAGINVEGGSSGATLANNIAVDNAINSPRATGNIRVDSASTLGTTVDYDLVHLSAPGHNFNWNGLGYATLAQFRTGVGQEQHGIEADPRWTSPATADFTLAAGSPAIDSANSGAPGQLSTDLAGGPRVDVPSVLNTGAGPRAYDDRGAYEQQLRNLPPAAALAVTPGSGRVDLDVTADASGSTDTDGVSSISTYAFDFGDGSPVAGPQAGPTASHTFTAAGTYTVTVTVTDSGGLTSTATAQVTVTDDPPLATLDVTPGAGFAPLAVVADASGSTDTDATRIASYSFDFGDGSPAVGPQPSATADHLYTAGGTFTVTVTVTDSAGLSSQATRQVSVSVGSHSPPGAALSVTPDTGPIDLAVTADASASTDDDGFSPIASYRFDFGDGSPAVGPQASATAAHTYTAPGTYTLAVTVTDTAGLSDTETRLVTVRDDPPAAALTVTPNAGMEPLWVRADASASTDADATPIESYRFDFGDGSPAVGPQAGPTAGHTYAVAGTYTVTVTVTDTAGLTGTHTAQVVVRGNAVRNPGFETDLSGWNTTGSGSGVTLERVAGGHGGDHAAKLANTGAAAATCTLNDGPDWARPTAAGTYSGSLWVRAESPGATLKLRFREWIGPTLVGSAVSQVTLGTAWREVSTSYTTQSPGSTLDFNAYVTGAALGTCFLADDAVIVLATSGDEPPAAALTVTPSSGVVDLEVTADASASTDDDGTSPIESYRFDFGDGSAAVGPQGGATASHTYRAAGTYVVTVTVRDEAGLSATETRQVTVRDDPPDAVLAVTPASGTAPLAVSADASASSDADATPIASYRFDFGDGSPAVGPQARATAEHTYAVAGTYTVTVTVTDSAGLSGSATAQVVVSGNLIRNPGFETDLSGWNTGSGTAVTLARTAGGHGGDHAATLTNTGAALATCTLNDSPDWARPTSGGTYAGSLWVRADTPGATLKLRFREWSGATLVGSAVTQATLTTAWQRISTSYATQSPGSTLDFNAYVTGAAPGTCFHADDAVIALG
jgi:parallel beta-helix repeat protein